MDCNGLMAGKTAMALRVDFAVQALLRGHGSSAVVTQLAEKEGISRRSAQRVVQRAYRQLADDIEAVGVDRRQMVAQLVHALQEALAHALASKQPAVVVGAVRALDDLVMLGCRHDKPHHRYR
jgi:hypothetical protein